ncbi:MAG: CDP-diacylglycerol--serine O-phosphatidyltransferase [Thiotrichales bacterium]|nr:CDP-diacylglycerol--serine O-phosphatidyltransferase [Thiotrichales bacterium]
MKRRRGIYILPNLFTTSAMFAGFYSVVSAINDRYEAAAVAIFIAMILDGMDGRIARLTNTQTDFGVQYDSLSDMVSFGLAPALVIYQWSLAGMGKIGWLGAFLFAAAAALRLARFNTQAGSADKRFFQGLPSPAAAAIIAGMIWTVDSHGALYDGTTIYYYTFPVTVITGLLMVSNIRYHSFKQFDLKGKVPFVSILVFILVLILIASEPPVVLFTVSSLYGLSGPVLTLIQIRKRRQERKSGDFSGPGAESS